MKRKVAKAYWYREGRASKKVGVENTLRKAAATRDLLLIETSSALAGEIPTVIQELERAGNGHRVELRQVESTSMQAFQSPAEQEMTVTTVLEWFDASFPGASGEEGSVGARSSGFRAGILVSPRSSAHAAAASGREHAPDATTAPFPFIVARGRSGTTLLRAMWDAHPQMAVPPESHFLVTMGRWRRRYESGRPLRRRSIRSRPREPIRIPAVGPGRRVGRKRLVETTSTLLPGGDA